MLDRSRCDTQCSKCKTYTPTPEIVEFGGIGGEPLCQKCTIDVIQRELTAAQAMASTAESLGQKWQEATDTLVVQDKIIADLRSQLAAAVEAKASSDAAYARLMDTAAGYRDARDAAVKRAEKAEAELEAIRVNQNCLRMQKQQLITEREESIKVLDPNMPEQGLLDACRQVKQAAIMHAENSDRLGVLWRQAEAERDVAYVERNNSSALLEACKKSLKKTEAERDALKAEICGYQARVIQTEGGIRAEVERLRNVLKHIATVGRCADPYQCAREGLEDANAPDSM